MPRQAETIPDRDETRALLEAYIAAFQNADPAALERVLRKDAALEPAGSLTWFSGRDTCMRYVCRFFGAPGVRPGRAHRDRDRYRPHRGVRRSRAGHQVRVPA